MDYYMLLFKLSNFLAQIFNWLIIFDNYFLLNDKMFSNEFDFEQIHCE